jgi:alanyl aminopeptidase
MENAGLITFRDDVLLLDPASASTSQRRSNANVICHELAHMWFGDLVTMAWWDDLWLNESFADWMAAKVTDQVYPQYRQGLNDLQRVQQVKGGDIQPSTTAIREKTTSASAGLTNVGLVYSKGNAVLSMFERYLGPETFQKGVQSYLKKHAWGNATASDLWQALDQVSGTNVSAAMTTFLDQPGVPYVRVVPAPGGVRLTQSRATPYGVSQPPMRWDVPMTLQWSDGKTVRSQRVLLKDESVVVKLPATPAWVMPNGGGHGYYSWSVPEEWMTTLAENAAKVLSPDERVAFLGDLSMLMTQGEVRGDTYLQSLSHFGSDPEPQVVSSTMESLTGVRGAFVPDSLESLFAVYVRRTLSPALERVGYEKKPGEDETVSTMRGDLLRWLANRGQDQKVLAFAQDAAKRYLADSTSVDPGIADAVVSLAAKKGDAALFTDYQRRLEATEVPAIRRRFLGALGAFEDTALTSRALEYSLSDKVRPTETFEILRGMGQRNEAAARAHLPVDDGELRSTRLAGAAAGAPVPAHVRERLQRRAAGGGDRVLRRPEARGSGHGQDARARRRRRAHLPLAPRARGRAREQLHARVRDQLSVTGPGRATRRPGHPRAARRQFSRRSATRASSVFERATMRT